MAIVEEKLIESKDGIKKTIDKQSMGMALDILQRGLYSFPIKSTVRELASNAHDAVKERDVAKLLISGTELIEDHFDISKGEDGIYHASGWDPTYFNLDWLDDDPYVRIYYEEGELRDTLRIVDNGVGLGKDRLLGYFQLNYSSKRANKDTLGRFGLGSKVPLSLGIESFRVINKYNGMKFKFDVYLDKIESIIPKFGKTVKNKSVQLTKDIYEGEELVKPGYEAYWESTTEKNSVEVQVQVKKHNKNAFFEAIESQLMYMPNILFLHRELDSISHVTIDIKAQIEYKDNDVVISKTTVYNRPHILLGTGDVLINYGFLAFNELEIEPRGGAVGLIMDINEIEVTPSREAPVWSSKTRKAILEKYEKVTETATKYVAQEIGTETDYLNWIRKAHSIIGAVRMGSSTISEKSNVLSTLASIIDFSEIKNLKFSPDPNIILKNDVKEMFGKEFLLRTIYYERWEEKVKRDVVKDLSELALPIYITTVGANKYKDRYLYEEEGGKFLLITARENYKNFPRADLILQSTIVKDYDDIEIPEDRLALYMGDGDDEDDDNDLASVTTVSRADLRKENKEIVVHVGNCDYNGNWVFSAEDRKISDMFNLKVGENVMYGTGNDRNTMKNLMKLLPPYFTRGKHSRFYNLASHKRLNAILVAKDNLKYIDSSSRFQNIGDIVLEKYDEKTGRITLTDRFKYVITALIIESYVYPMLDGKGFNLSNVLSEGHADTKLTILMGEDPEFKEICEYIFDSVYYLNKIKYDVRYNSNFKFLSKLGRLHLIDVNIIEFSDEDKETLLEEINDELPDYLCDVVGEISSVDVLYEDLFIKSRDMLLELKRGWPIINLYAQKYYYRDEEKEEVAKDVRIYLKAIANDASLQ